MSEMKMTYKKSVEHYEMVLPDKSEVIVEVHHNQEVEGSEVGILIKNKETDEIIEDFKYLGDVKQYLFHTTFLLGD